MITEKISLSKSNFQTVIWGAVIFYLATAVFLHSGSPELLDFTAKTGFLLILAYFLKKVGITVPALIAYALPEIKTDFFKAAKYFAIIVISVVLIISSFAGLLAIVTQLSPWLASFLEGPTLSAQMLPQAFSSPLRTFFYLATLCVIAPIAEEIFFRRFLFISLRKKHSKIYAITGSAVIFGVVHFEGFIVAAIMGAFLAYIYEKEEKLTIPIMVHAFKNITAILAGLAYYHLN